MGKKAVKAGLITLCLILLFVTNTYASTANDIYSLYGLTYSKACPITVTETIDQYQRAIKYVSMYKYVMESEFDTTTLKQRKQSVENEINIVKDKLLGGCNLTMSDIYKYENMYSDLSDELYEIECALDVKNVEYSIPDIGKVPTEKVYKKALNLKEQYNPYKNIGNLKDLKYPVVEGALIEDTTPTHLTLRTASNSTVISLLAGNVIDTTENSITIYNGCDLYTYYGNLRTLYVSKGDTVKQGDILGKSSKRLTLKIKIANMLCNPDVLFNR